MRSILLATVVAAATPAFAQSNAPAPIRQPNPPQQVAPGTPGTPPGTVAVPGGATNSGSGAGAVVAPTGTGAATVTTDSAAGGNADQPERGVPQMGRGGGGNAGGQ
ncbi:hypothetical protein MKK64_17905 [Methylobacterium sp. E-025]|uniref:hypothetical protein n=1 Tax=Methylobacterium sp. E-025 TaxID=2836561 RepID=UPI001FBC0611|nr:hypothetical protein [Methylobacterium sp. E-025]MCJ2113057.1 hypothetical protein [Methylobacterium sp. E-025]